MVVDEQEELGLAAACHPRGRHPGTAEHIADPALVGTGGLVATEAARLGDQRGALQPAALELLAEGALTDADAVSGEEHVADLRSAAGRLLTAQCRGLAEEIGMPAHRTHVSAHLGAQPRQATAAICRHPAVDGVATDGPRAPIRARVRTRGERTHDLAALQRSQPRVDRFGDDRVAEQRGGFGVVGRHGELRGGGVDGVGGMKRLPPTPAQGGLVVVPSSSPPVTALTKHQSSATLVPNRCRACCQAAPIAVSDACRASAGRGTCAPPRSTPTLLNPALSMAARRW